MSDTIIQCRVERREGDTLWTCQIWLDPDLATVGQALEKHTEGCEDHKTGWFVVFVGRSGRKWRKDMPRGDACDIMNPNAAISTDWKRPKKET